MSQYSDQVRAALAAGDKLLAERRYPEALERWQQALRTAEAGATGSNSAPLLAEAHAAVARGFALANRHSEGAVHLAEAERLASPDNSAAWTRTQGVKGRYLWKEGKLAEAAKVFLALYEYCEERQLNHARVDAAHMLHIVSPELEDRLAWGERTLKLAEAIGEHGWIGPVANNLGWDYADLKDYERSLHFLKQARDYHWQHSAEIAKLIADWSLGAVYNLRKEFTDAESWLRPCLAWAERLAASGHSQAQQWRGFSARELGRAAAALGRKAEAVELLSRAVEDLTAAGQPEWDAKGFGELTAELAALK